MLTFANRKSPPISLISSSTQKWPPRLSPDSTVWDDGTIDQQNGDWPEAKNQNGRQFSYSNPKLRLGKRKINGLTASEDRPVRPETELADAVLQAPVVEDF